MTSSDSPTLTLVYTFDAAAVSRISISPRQSQMTRGYIAERLCNAHSVEFGCLHRLHPSSYKLTSCTPVRPDHEVGFV